MDDQIERYLRRLATWVQGGYISVHYKLKRENQKPIFPGHACSNIAQAIRQTRYWAFNRNTDVYLAQGAQREHGGMAERGPKLFSAIRRIHNIIASKSLYMDVDVDTDPKKDAYRTVEELEDGLEKFYRRTNIPHAPVVVQSGRGGKHLYWPFSNLVHPDDFKPLASALVNAAMSTGLKFDSNCTVDICRLLRIPGTFNFKTGKPLQVIYERDDPDEYDIDTVQSWLAPWWNAPTISSYAGGEDDDGEDWSDTDSLGAGIDDHSPADIELVRKECPFIDNTINSGGAGYSQGLWFLSLGIACHTTDPLGNAQLFSKGYAAYEPTEVAEKLKELQLTRQRYSKIGPPKCLVISQQAKECATCKHRDRGTTPISFGIATVSGSIRTSGRINDTDLPLSYFRGARNEHIYLNAVDSDESTQPEMEVFPFKIKPYSGFIEKSEGIGYKLAFITYEAGQEKSVLIDAEQVSDKFAMSRGLAKQGLLGMMNDHGRRFLVSYYNKLMEVKENIIDIPPVGWHQKDSEMGFAFNGEFITPTITLRCHLLPPEASNYGVLGDIQPWIDLAKIVVNPLRPDLSVLVASGFAAPLVIISGQQGFMVGCWSAASGIAKSTAITLAQTIWGSPLAINGLNDTPTHLFAKATILHSLPIFFDEIKTVTQISNFLSVVFQVTSGREKARANRDGTMKATKGWELPVIYASNSSMTEAAEQHHKGSPAMLYRMFEFVGLPNTTLTHSPSDISRMSGKLFHNYGAVGRIYAEFLGRNYGSCVKLVQSIQHDFEQKLQINQEERYWVAAMATTMAGAYLAKKLNLAPFDLESIEKFLIEQFKKMRIGKTTSSVDYSIPTTVVHELSQFLGPLRGRQTVVTDILWMQPGRPPKGVVKVLNDSPVLQHDYIRVQIAKLPQLLLRFADAELADYCYKKGIPKATLTEAMKTKLSGKLGPARIASGTSYANLTEMCWTFGVTGTPLEQEVEWATQYFS